MRNTGMKISSPQSFVKPGLSEVTIQWVSFFAVVYRTHGPDCHVHIHLNWTIIVNWPKSPVVSGLKQEIVQGFRCFLPKNCSTPRGMRCKEDAFINKLCKPIKRSSCPVQGNGILFFQLILSKDHTGITKLSALTSTLLPWYSAYPKTEKNSSKAGDHLDPDTTLGLHAQVTCCLYSIP